MADLIRSPLLEAAQVETLQRRLEEAFLPHRCWVNVTEDQHLDFEVMTLMGDPVVAFTSSPVEMIAPPTALAALITEAKQVGRERGHTFDTP